MDVPEPQKSEAGETAVVRRYNPALEGIVNTVEWVLIALILAFVFRAFVMEAFRIPTGSMAETLRGNHYCMRCLRCGYSFDYGTDAYTGTSHSQCPSCGLNLPDDMDIEMSNGDRILVLKCLYQFFEPKRWDVVVFKNPLDPVENYIKRMIALPGETVEIIDGDIFIDGQIARKPKKVQEELWMPVYLNDYQPFSENLKTKYDEKNPNGWHTNTTWHQPFEHDGNDKTWDLCANGSTVFALHETDDRLHKIVYNPNVGNDFRVRYGYNENSLNHGQPFCSDVMMRFYTVNTSGQVGIELSKYGTKYRAVAGVRVMEIFKLDEQGETTWLCDMSCPEYSDTKTLLMEFAVVDLQLIFRYGDNVLRYDLAKLPDADSMRRGYNNRNKNDQPDVKIIASGDTRVMHIGLYRDTYYVTDSVERAQEKNPFALGKDEFFVCGDNSPNSLDARCWRKEGKGNNHKTYRMGIVPRDLMMGKAFFIYWSNAFRPVPGMVPVIPNLSKIGFIYGNGPVEY